MKKNLIKGLVLAAASFFYLNQVSAQEATGYYEDVVRYSRTTFGGTARYQGMAGTGTALGADLSTTAINPAGLGVYRKSDFSFSTGMGFTGATADYLDNTNKSSRAHLFFPNFGVSFLTQDPDDLSEKAWKGGSFAITYNRTNNFHDKVSMFGTNKDNSMLFKFWEIVENSGYTPGINGDIDYISPNELQDLPSLIYWSWLVQGRDKSAYYPDEDYYPVDPNSDFITFRTTPTRQEYTVTTKGGQNLWNISYGGNFDNRFYIGASLGIASLRYNVEKIYQEKTLEENPDVESFAFAQNFTTKGTGINFRVGAIYKITDNLRAGMSFQTPTYYGMRENYRYSIDATFNNYPVPGAADLEQESVKTIPALFDYNMTTPGRVNGGIAWFSQKRGFITADIEYVPYNTASLSFKEDNFLFAGDNRFISDNLKGALNTSIGGELRNGPFMVRAGFARLADAYSEKVDGVSRAVYTITTGAGVRYPDYYFDAAIVNSRSKNVIMPYSLENGNGPVGNIKNTSTSVILTFGTYF